MKGATDEISFYLWGCRKMGHFPPPYRYPLQWKPHPRRTEGGWTMDYPRRRREVSRCKNQKRKTYQAKNKRLMPIGRRRRAWNANTYFIQSLFSRFSVTNSKTNPSLTDSSISVWIYLRKSTPTGISLSSNTRKSLLKSACFIISYIVLSLRAYEINTFSCLVIFSICWVISPLISIVNIFFPLNCAIYSLSDLTHREFAALSLST